MSLTLNWEVSLASILITTIISGTVTYLINHILVQRNQKLRDHAEKLNENALKDWNGKFKKLCQIGAEYSHTDSRFIPKKLGDFSEIKFHQFIQSHMESGYSDVWKSWNDLLESNCIRNMKESDFKDKIRKNAEQKLHHKDFSIWYWKSGSIEPRDYFRPDLVANLIFDEARNRSQGFEVKWPGWEPTIVDTGLPGGGKQYFLNFGSWGHALSKSTNQQNVGSVQQFIESIIDTNEIITGIEQIIKLEKDFIQKQEIFENFLSSIIWKITLGDKLKGYCDICAGVFNPKQFYLKLKN